MKRKKLYISLPVTGRNEESRKEANILEEFYRRQGFVVFNPHKIADELYQVLNYQPTEANIMAACIDSLANSDIMVLAPNWSDSWGCNMELHFANKYNIPVYQVRSDKRIYFHSEVKVKSSVLIKIKSVTSDEFVHSAIHAEQNTLN